MIRSFQKDFQALCQEKNGRRALMDSKTSRVWTYGVLFKHIVGFSAFLKQQGVKPGERIFSILPNGVEQLVAFLAALWSGVDFCPISPLSTANEVSCFANMTNCVTGLVPEGIAADLAGKLSSVVSNRKLLPITIDGDLSRYEGKFVSNETESRAGKLIIFTSGTTSSPKALVLNGDRLWSAAKAWIQFHPFLTEESRFYNVLPMSYLGGLFNLGLIPFACEGSVVLADAFSGVSALRFFKEIEQYGVNILWFAPTMLRVLSSLYKNKEVWQKACRDMQAAFLGMAPIALAEKEAFEEKLGIKLLENYALSETTFITSETLDSVSKRVPGSVGEILPWVEAKLEKSEEEGLEEIKVKTPFLLEAYLAGKTERKPTLTSEGFFATGDLGIMEKECQLLVKGRSKEIVKKGGYLVLLRDLEEIAGGHPAVSEAVAFRTEHPFYGETPILCLQIEKGGSTQAILEGVKNALIKNIAKFKWPSQIIVMQSFPRTDSGKVKRQALEDCVNQKKGILGSLSL